MTVLAQSIKARHDALNANNINTQSQTQSIYDDNTMYLYRDKIIEYLDDEMYHKQDSKPFYMYLALQTIHGPLNEVPEKIAECQSILALDATNRRQKYCQNMLLTDDVIGAILDKLRENEDVYGETLIVFTSDNGGDVSNKGCNYPLRGTKGTLFDGNLRTMALIGGGLIPQTQRGTERDQLFSSLDWTPTLLKFADLLHKIDKKDFSWDGINQYDLIMNGQSADNKIRDHIVMNIGLRNLESSSIVFRYEKNQKLYKYISKSDKIIDRWAYIRDDGWCVPGDDGNFNLILDEDMSDAQSVDNQYLFDLEDDIAEKHNLLNLNDNHEIIQYAKDIMTGYTEHYLYSEPLTFLWNRLPAGDPSDLGDGAFVAPFLNEEDYTFHLRKGFKAIDAKYGGQDISPYSKALQAMYFKHWQPPKTQQSQTNKSQLFTVFDLMPALLIAVLSVSIYFVSRHFYHYYYYQRKGYSKIQETINELI